MDEGAARSFEEKRKRSAEADSERLLRRAFVFSDFDLDANRAGALSKAQIGRLERRAQEALRNAGVSAGVFGLLALLIAVRGPLPLLAKVVILAAMGIGVAVIIVGHLYRWRTHRADAGSGLVSAVEGRVQLAIEELRNKSEYTIGIHHLSFKVDKDALLALKNGELYRLYYAPRTMTILSAERLDERALAFEVDTDSLADELPDEEEEVLFEDLLGGTASKNG